MEVLFIFAGGAIGALLRYFVSLTFSNYPHNIAGTFIVNITGCFIIGFVSYLAIKRNNIISKQVKYFFTIGLAGGLTTFSTFSYDTLVLILNHHYMISLLYMFASVILGLIFVSWGMNSGFYLLNYLLRRKRIKQRMENN